MVYGIAKIRLADMISIAGKGHVRVENLAAWKLSGGLKIGGSWMILARRLTRSVLRRRE